MEETNNEFSGKKENEKAPIRLTCNNCVHYNHNNKRCSASWVCVSPNQCTCELFMPRRLNRVLAGYRVLHATGETPQAALDSLSRKLSDNGKGSGVTPVGGAALLEVANRTGGWEWLAYQTIEAFYERVGK